MILLPCVAPVPLWIPCGAKIFAWLFGPYPSIHGEENINACDLVFLFPFAFSLARSVASSPNLQGKSWQLGSSATLSYSCSCHL